MVAFLSGSADPGAAGGDHRRPLLIRRLVVISEFLRFALLTVGLLAADTLLAADAADEKPKLTARPQGFNTGLALTTLDEKTAFERSQSAIGKQVGDFVLLDRQGKPVYPLPAIV